MRTFVCSFPRESDSPGLACRGAETESSRRLAMIKKGVFKAKEERKDAEANKVQAYFGVQWQ
eukprot:3387476-Rhodomonas_salina.1